MSMTKLERYAKAEVVAILNEEGYPTYARLFDKFEFNLTDDPGVVAYLEPAKGRIVINSGLDIDQVSVIARHEILHNYLKHEQRLLDKVARDSGVEVSDLTIDQLKDQLYKNSDFNIAGDYEISNRGYTEEDKATVRAINLNGQILTGLVTEDDHPEWVDMSIEEMYDELLKQRKKDEQEAKQDINEDSDCITGAFADPVTFIGTDGRIYGI